MGGGRGEEGGEGRGEGVLKVNACQRSSEAHAKQAGEEASERPQQTEYGWGLRSFHPWPRTRPGEPKDGFAM